MNLHVHQSKLEGQIHIVPSKSIMHRALIAASLADGESVINNPLFAIDTLQTLEGLRKLGALFETRLDSVTVRGGNIKQSLSPIDTKESGSTIRFLVPISLLTEEKEEFTLSPTLAQRPMTPYKDVFKDKGIYFHQEDNKIYTKGPILPGEYVIRGDVSSQFISGLLFVLPILDGDSKIIVTQKYESKSYVDLTISILKAFEIDVVQNKNIITIKGNQKYVPTSIRIEGDYSQAAFFLVAAALGQNVELKGLNKTSLQGDKAILDFLHLFGCEVVFDETVKVRKGNYKKISYNITNTPDLGPIMFAMAAISGVEVTIKGIRRLQFKESNRIKAMCDNLKLLGSKFEVFENHIIFYPSELKGGQIVESYKDHRIVMSMAIIATILEGGLIIKDTEAVKKSYPTFFDDLRQLGAKIDEVK